MARYLISASACVLLWLVADQAQYHLPTKTWQLKLPNGSEQTVSFSPALIIRCIVVVFGIIIAIGMLFS